jgi:hypothetical protein
MFNQLVVLQPLDKAALSALAAQRGAAIAEYLKTAAGLEAQRVNVKAAAEVKADKATEIPTALNLDAGK